MHVIIVGANAGLFPHRLSDNLEEERRIFHVALTRGIERVDIICDKDRPSPFLDQMRATANRQTAPSAHERPRPRIDPILVLKHLRAWRAAAAATMGVPAYVIFHDRHLHDIAQQQPQTRQQLSECLGVGPAKLDRFGDQLLAVINPRPSPA